MSDYRVTGRVVDTAGVGIHGLRVEAWDKDLLCDDLIGTAQTGPGGSFDLTFTERYFSDLFMDRRPDLFFKVFRGDDLLQSTERSVRWNTRAGDLPVTIALQPHAFAGAGSALVPEEHLATIHEAITAVAGDDQAAAAQYRTTVDALVRHLAPLEMVLHDARAFLAGGIVEGNRLLALLNTVAMSPALPATPGPPAGGIHEIPGDIDYPRLDWPLRHSCLLSARTYIDMYAAISRLPELPLPGIGSPSPYLRVLDRMAEAMAPLQVVFAAARDVAAGRPYAAGYFRSALTFAQSGWSTQAPLPGPGPSMADAPAAAAQFPIPVPAISAGYAGPIGNIPEIPGLALDWCRLERQARTAAAVDCITALMHEPQYQITDIVNLSRGGSRRGCAGDTMRIAGLHFGTSGTLSHGLRRRPMSTLSWTDTEITFILPPEFTGDAVYPCAPPQTGGCGGMCRMAALGTSHTLTRIYPVVVEEFTLGGSATADPERSGHFTAEACSPVQLRVRVSNAETAEIVDGGGERVWTAGDASPVELRVEDAAEYVLTASNFCNADAPWVQRLRLDVTRRITLAPVRMAFGIHAEVPLSISCPARVEGAGLVASVEDRTVAEPDVSGVQIAAGERAGSIRLLPRGIGVTRLVVEDPAGLYPRADVEVRVVPALSAPATEITAYINQELVIRGAGFVPGATALLFGDRAVAATVAGGGTEARAEVPEWAVNGTVAVQVTVDGTPLATDAVRFSVLDPWITPFARGSRFYRGGPLEIRGQGFSRTPANNTVEISSGGRQVPTLPTASTPNTLSCIIPPNAPFTTMLVRVRRPDGGSRVSASLDLPLFREPGPLDEIPFENLPGPVTRGRTTLVRSVTAGQVSFEVTYEGRPNVSGTAVVGGVDGGVGLSPSGSAVAMLSYIGGAFDSRAQGIHFNMKMWNASSGEELLEWTVYSTCTGLTRTHVPRLFVSEDLSIAAIIDAIAIGPLLERVCMGRVRFRDVARGTWLPREGTSLDLSTFSAEITDDNEIAYVIDGVPQVPPIDL